MMININLFFVAVLKLLNRLSLCFYIEFQVFYLKNYFYFSHKVINVCLLLLCFSVNKIKNEFIKKTVYHILMVQIK